MRKIYFLLILLSCWKPTHAQSGHWQSIGIHSVDWNDVHMWVDTQDQLMYIFGDFHMVNGVSGNVIKWDGQQYSLLPHCPLYFINSMTKYKGELYVSGQNGVSRFDGTNWHRLDSSVNTYVRFITVFQNKLLACGPYKKIGGQNIANAALWDGNSWSDFYRVDTLLADVNWTIEDVVEYKGEIYIAGNFNPQGKPGISDIARFDGKNWRDVGGGLKGGGLTGLGQLMVWNNKLYIAGGFLESIGSQANNVATWDGVKWDRLGDGIPDWAGLYGMCLYKNNLYVAGGFKTVGWVPAMHVGKWDGSRWCNLGTDTFSNILLNVCEFKGDLYISGGFMHINGDSSLSYVAKWTGGNYTDSCSAPLNIEPAEQLLKPRIYPNPALEMLTIDQTSEVRMVHIYSVEGRLVKEYRNTADQIRIPLADIASGMLLIRMECIDGSVISQVFSKH
jgi:hypothetical protein